MKAPDTTLAELKKSPKLQGETYRVSDFLSKEEVEKLHERNKKKQIKPKFDQIDALEAEIIARFGYETYKAWDEGEISNAHMKKWLYAEHARDAAERLSLMAVMANGFGGCYQSKKQAQAAHRAIKKVINAEIKAAKGEF